MNSFYTRDELLSCGFKNIGENVLISSKASFYGTENMSFGNNVRIDDFCILSGKIIIGSYVHISAYSAIYGANGVQIDDYSGLSPRCIIFSAMDDFSGEFLINPMVDKSLTHVTGGKVLLKKFVQIGASSIVFPNLTIETGSVIGSLSLVNKSLEEWGIYAGIPVRKIKDRSKNILNKI